MERTNETNEEDVQTAVNLPGVTQQITLNQIEVKQEIKTIKNEEDVQTAVNSRNTPQQIETKKIEVEQEQQKNISEVTKEINQKEVEQK